MKICDSGNLSAANSFDNLGSTTKGSMCPHAYGVLCKRDSCDGCEWDRRAKERSKPTVAEITRLYMDRPDRKER
jgi:hypothetical protein